MLNRIMRTLKAMSNSNKSGDRVVYLTLKNVIMGNVAEMRKLAAIRKVTQLQRNVRLLVWDTHTPRCMQPT